MCPECPERMRLSRCVETYTPGSGGVGVGSAVHKARQLKGFCVIFEVNFHIVMYLFVFI